MEENLKEIIDSNEPHFSDINMAIVDFKIDFFKDFEIIAKGLHGGLVVGVKIILKSDIKPGIIDGQISYESFTKGGVQFKSIGKESDNFIMALSSLYKTKEVKNFTIKSVVTNSLALCSNVPNIEKEKVKFQLTFDPEDKKQLKSELYLDIDVASGKIILGEKDQEWRNNIVGCFA